MRKKRLLAKVLVTATACALSVGCLAGCGSESASDNTNEENQTAEAQEEENEYSDTITLVWYPNESAENFTSSREEVGKLIEEATGKKVEQKLTTDYAIAIEALSSGTAQIGCVMGAEGYIQAKNSNDAVEPLFVNSGESGTLDDVSFAVEEGEFVSIIGPSGAGKSTLLRCINRLINASQGVVTFDGQDITHVKGKELRNIRTKTGMIFQHYNLVDRLSVIENVLHRTLGKKSTISGMVGHYTEEEKEKAFDILKELGLGDQVYKRCDELSGGQKQRVGIARAIMQQPKLILCDEPIASLDPKASKVIMDQLAEINKKKKITCIVNLHQVDVAMKYSQRILGVAGGKIVFDGAPEELDQSTIHRIYQSSASDLITDISGGANGQR